MLSPQVTFDLTRVDATDRVESRDTRAKLSRVLVQCHDLRSLSSYTTQLVPILLHLLRLGRRKVTCHVGPVLQELLLLTHLWCLVESQV